MSPVATPGSLAERLLDATEAVLAERGWAAVTMAAVAARAGVSRQSLYNAFGSRDELAQAYVLRAADRFLAEVEEAVRAHPDDPRAALAAAFSVFLIGASSHPVFRGLADDRGDELLALLTTQGDPVVTRAGDRLSAVLHAGWPVASPEDCRLLADTTVRLAISHAALPTEAPERTAADVTAVLGPYVERVTRAAP